MRGLTIAALVAAGAVAAGAVAAAPFAASGIADWTKPPPPAAEQAFKPPVPRRLALHNGMTLVVIENHTLPIFAAELIVPGAGAAIDPAGKAGLAALTADLLDEGAGGLSALQIAQEQDRLGAEVGLGVSADTAFVFVHGLTKTLDPTFALVANIVTKPAFDPGEFERVRGDRLTSLELRRDRPREVAQLALAAALYGPTSAYGHPANGSRGEFGQLTVADARQF